MVMAHQRGLIGWYERLGFVGVDEHGPYIEMEARPPGAEGA
jgi:ribosomal protein S18 acetylase RimI-like enzyme